MPSKKANINRGLTGVSSKYEEDKYEQDHTSVWGSYWHSVLGWGYQCCFSFDRKSKCTGEQGKVETIKREYEIELAAKRKEEEETK
jgi:pre-mRNA-processing factor SLU7